MNFLFLYQGHVLCINYLFLLMYHAFTIHPVLLRQWILVILYKLHLLWADFFFILFWGNMNVISQFFLIEQPQIPLEAVLECHLEYLNSKRVHQTVYYVNLAPGACCKNEVSTRGLIQGWANLRAETWCNLHSLIKYRREITKLLKLDYPWGLFEG